MAVELYYVPINETATISLDELLKQLTAAGLCCRIEPEAERMFWVVLNEHESCILASVKQRRSVCLRHLRNFA